MATRQAAPAQEDRAIRIEYCTGWGYLKRAASLAEHLLHDYHKELPGGVRLMPSSGGVFEISLDDRPLFSKKDLGRFPEEGEVDRVLTEALA